MSSLSRCARCSLRTQALNDHALLQLYYYYYSYRYCFYCHSYNNYYYCYHRTMATTQIHTVIPHSPYLKLCDHWDTQWASSIHTNDIPRFTFPLVDADGQVSLVSICATTRALPEVMGPLRHAMSLINTHERNTPFRRPSSSRC